MGDISNIKGNTECKESKIQIGYYEMCAMKRYDYCMLYAFSWFLFSLHTFRKEINFCCFFLLFLIFSLVKQVEQYTIITIHTLHNHFKHSFICPMRVFFKFFFFFNGILAQLNESDEMRRRHFMYVIVKETTKKNVSLSANRTVQSNRRKK